jgi:hypothetical protein
MILRSGELQLGRLDRNTPLKPSIGAPLSASKHSNRQPEDGDFLISRYHGPREISEGKQNEEIFN